MDVLTTIPTPLHESAHHLWYPSTNSQLFNLAPSNTSSNSTSQHQSHQAQHAQHQQTQQRQSARAASRNFLSQLRSDENSINARRANIRRFGAGWLKPPGIGKTMQGLWDEYTERQEAEAAAQREATLAEAQAAAEAMAAGNDGAGTGGDGGEGQAEHDLDDDIPAAEEDGEWLDTDAEEEAALPTNEVDGDFAPDGMRMSVIGEGAGDMMERDLDDEVPDAASYQHTDTDVEDSSSVEDDHGIGRSSIGMASVVGFAGLASSPIPAAGRR